MMHRRRPAEAREWRHPGALSAIAIGAFLLCAHALACGDSTAPSPFAPIDAGVDAPAADDDAAGGSEAGDDPTLGGPCSDARQCDDEVACTDDRCDRDVQRCRFEPNHASCADDVHCDGEEQCVPGLGCREGEPVACSDESTCTIDRCIEATRSCEHTLRDADGDGDVVWNCRGGDCDDTNPDISSAASERCDNGRDDDCDGALDEDDCARPEHDTCLDALEISAAGSYALSLDATARDYPLSCQDEDFAFRDVVVAVIVPEPEARDVLLTATSAGGHLALGSALQCGNRRAESACEPSYTTPQGDEVSRLRLRALEPGAHAVYVTGDREAIVSLDVAFEEPVPAPANETCGTAEDINSGQHRTVSLIGVATDLSSACGDAVGELVYRFDLSEARDVTLRALPLDSLGTPVISLRSAACSPTSSELTCRESGPAELFARALPAGEYFAAISATAPTELDLELELEAPSAAMPGEGCSAAATLAAGTTYIDFAKRVDAVQSGCLVGAPDASYELELARRSDVLLVAKLSEDDDAALLIAAPACASTSDQFACGANSQSPLRVAAHALEAGSYRVVAESGASKPIALDVFERAAAPPIYVAFADECAGAVKIPESGGRFEGNTAGQFADYDASCDYGGVPAGGAPEQMLRLDLSSKRRVVLDMQGSEYDTMLAVRRGPDCPGTEVIFGCSVGEGGGSFRDLVLEAGIYFIQVDGYDGESGRWLLDAYIEPP